MHKLILVQFSLFISLGLLRQVFLNGVGNATEGNAMNLKKTGAVLCKGGAVRMGAPVDTECSVQMRSELTKFSGVKLNAARCEKGVCILEYKECDVPLYECRAECFDNKRLEARCKIVAPPNSTYKFNDNQTKATLNIYRRDDEDMYY